MNFFRLILLISLSFGIGVHSSHSEVLAESEKQESKEIVDTNYLINRRLNVRSSPNGGIPKISSYNLFTQTNENPQSIPRFPVKRHVWVMQFLL